MATNQNDQESNFPKMSAPAHRALQNAGYTRLEQLAAVSEAEIKQLHGMGPKALKEVHAAMSAAGLTFANAKK